MAPNGNKRATSELGHVFPHDNGYRVQAQIDGKKERGPCRCTQAAAKQDLRKAQAADNHKQYADVLKQLREAAKSAASEAPSGVTQPAASASQQQASATTFEKQCQQILDYRRAHGGRAPCQSKSDPNEHQLGQMKSKLKRRCQKAVGVKPSQIKLTPEQSSHLDWCLSDGAMQSVDCRAPSDHSEPGTHVNNDENPSSPNKRLRVYATSPCGCHIATVSLRLRDDGVPVTLCLRGLNIQFKVTE